ncbi:RES family NAD+ phosphorylase [Ramlibacter albus]|uniref:RES family NAD+ phosphorylase n=1 Tax=Ramlibacter albus TaxID=2079448 RepID=A0A923MFJ1_9BURK|nr:RES family NAD+ phosphorylase [Ramlibacter albus]MBC5768062.1 RES family NAD+ phosphorylase [Ramlibacter albus]
MMLWRIAEETRQYRADDLSGTGAAQYPGRWNNAGAPVLYTTLTISLAALETAAHMAETGLPGNRYVVRIDVPEHAWRNRQVLAPEALPVTWDAIPAGESSAELGAEWLAAGASAILLVPSVIVPEEAVALINPAHPDAAKIKATAVRSFEYSRLFR